MPRALVVVDLGYGDAGKGTTVDYLVRQCQSRLVVRFNGGPQAAHNVITDDGRHHTFSTWGSGTLAGASTYLSEHVLFDPISAGPEAEHLKELGVADPWGMLRVDERCSIITPYHIGANRIRERSRGDSRHGSCGLGIGETMQDVVDGVDMVRFGHLDDVDLAERLEEARQRKLRPLLEELGHHITEWSEWDLFMRQDPRSVATTMRQAFHKTSPVREITPIDRLSGDIVFEGAQGVLIDEVFGKAPYHTWSNCTFGNALSLTEGMEAVRLGVTRTYTTRHGPGPMPGEDWTLGMLLPEKHNAANEWQGGWRVGHLEIARMADAIGFCGGIDGLVVTHMDRWSPKIGMQERHGRSPGHRSATEFVGSLEENLGSEVFIQSWGPSTAEKVLIKGARLAQCST